MITVVSQILYLLPYMCRNQHHRASASSWSSSLTFLKWHDLDIHEERYKMPNSCWNSENNRLLTTKLLSVSSRPGGCGGVATAVVPLYKYEFDIIPTQCLASCFPESSVRLIRICNIWYSGTFDLFRMSVLSSVLWVSLYFSMAIRCENRKNKQKLNLILCWGKTNTNRAAEQPTDRPPNQQTKNTRSTQNKDDYKGTIQVLNPIERELMRPLCVVMEIWAQTVRNSIY